MATIYDIDADTINAFTKAYILSLDPALQALWVERITNNPSVDFGTTYKKFMDLAKTGTALVNLDVDAMGTTPLTWMLSVENAGYKCMWNALQPAGNVSAYSDPNPKNWPPGAILVSSNIADWPPHDGAPPAPAPFDPAMVGNDLGFQIDGKEVFSARAQAHFPEGYRNGAYSYHLMGTELMDPRNRTGVWLKN